MAALPTDDLPYFFVSTRPHGSDAVIVACGELDMAGAPRVAQTLAEAIATHCRRVVVDASGVTFIDGAGVRPLLRRPDGQVWTVEIVLRAPSPPVQRLVELLGITGLLESPSLGTPASNESLISPVP